MPLESRLSPKRCATQTALLSAPMRVRLLAEAHDWHHVRTMVAAHRRCPLAIPASPLAICPEGLFQVNVQAGRARSTRRCGSTRELYEVHERRPARTRGAGAIPGSFHARASRRLQSRRCALTGLRPRRPPARTPITQENEQTPGAILLLLRLSPLPLLA